MAYSPVCALCLALVALSLCLAAAASAAEAPAADIAAEVAALARWKPLWDGKTFDGWHEIGKGSWTITDGAIHATHPRSEREFGHLVTDRTFTDFTVRLKYKAVKGNSGLYFRIEEKGASGVSGFQAEIDPNHDAGGLYETNGRAWVVKPTPEQVKTWYKPDAWNEMTVTALGRNVTVHVNGVRSAALVGDPGRTEGRFALQVHGGQDCEVLFKDIEILEWKNLAPGPGMAGWRKPTGDWAMVGQVVKDPANEKRLAVKAGAGVIYNGPTPTPASTSWAATRSRCSTVSARRGRTRASSAAASTSGGIGNGGAARKGSRATRRGSTPPARRVRGRRSTSSSGRPDSTPPAPRLPTPGSSRSSTTASSCTRTSK